MEKQYYIGKVSKSGAFTFISDRSKVSELIFNNLLDAKIKELVGSERMDQFDKCKKDVLDALETKKPVAVLDRNFEILIKKIKK